jgi:hypothetical protein
MDEEGMLKDVQLLFSVAFHDEIIQQVSVQHLCLSARHSTRYPSVVTTVFMCKLTRGGRVCLCGGSIPRYGRSSV